MSVRRARALICGGLAVGYGLLLLSAAERDRMGDLRGPTASFCYHGVMPSLCLGCTVHSTFLHEDWGPNDFRMSARGLAVPGLEVGYLTNSAGVCTAEEATSYGEGLAGDVGSPAD